MGPEAKIEKAVVDYAKKRGFWVRKFKSPGQRSVPDRIFITPLGNVFFIEFKAQGKKPTAMQQREIDLINAGNGRAHWTDNVADGFNIVDYYRALS